MQQRTAIRLRTIPKIQDIPGWNTRFQAQQCAVSIPEAVNLPGRRDSLAGRWSGEGAEGVNVVVEWW